MLRVFLALNLLLLNLLACKGGYKTCVLKVKDSRAIQGQTLQIPISKNQNLVYSKLKPHAKIIKHNPFLNLYITENKHGFRFPFKINYKLSLGSSSVNAKMAIEGRIKRKQIGLNKFANYSEVISAPSLLLSSCCSLEGLVTPDGIIEKDYVNYFLKNKKVEYGDIGIRVSDVKGRVIIQRVDPFDYKNQFKKGDVILFVNSKKVKNSAFLMHKILLSGIGKKLRVKVKRDGKIFSIDVVTKNRYGGGYVSDTFLESKGIYFNDDLKIVKIANKDLIHGLRPGDRLVQVNSKEVRSLSDVREHIDGFKFHSTLLFVRNKFQFFVNIK